MATDAAAEQVRRRRARCKIPDRVRHREKWRLALDMIDEITGEQAAGGWGLPARPVVTDAGYGEITAFRLGLQARGLPYVAAVKGTTSAYPASAVPERLPYAGTGRPPVPRYRGQPASLRDLALGAGGKPAGMSPGGTARRRHPAIPPPRCGPGSPHCASGQPTATSPAPPAAACPNAG
jgi:hypothetical protein